jgi:hypothetical protein
MLGSTSDPATPRQAPVAAFIAPIVELRASGALPIPDALPIARQIAEALEAADEKGSSTATDHRRRGGDSNRRIRRRAAAGSGVELAEELKARVPR